MGLGFNAFENFVEDEDDGPKKYVSKERLEDEDMDTESSEYKKIKREIKKDHKNADPRVIERLIRERLEVVSLEMEKS